ncbi:helix-turn-helix domain-containing protein [Haloarcula sp. H-GB5]
MAEQLRRSPTPVDPADVVDAVYRCTPAGTVEVAEILGVSRQAATYHLRDLEDTGRVWSKKVGTVRVWIHPRIMSEPTPKPPR